MGIGAEQWHLAWALLLCAAPLAVGYRLARRFSPPLDAIPDALLLTYLAQYLAVGIPGVLGFLSPGSITVFVGAFCILAWLAAGRPMPLTPLQPFDRIVVLACVLFVIGYIGAFVYTERLVPPLATDALTYHLPAAVQWLQHRRIDLFATWFFNPANTYSPLAGSLFGCFLLAPVGNDALARFVQIGPLLLIFFSLIQLGRRCGGSTPAATILALAAVLSRPLLSQSDLAKDDLFVAAFFCVVAANLAADNLHQPFSAARIGIALGLMLATKYTALLALPMFLLALDAPLRARWRWRHWTCAIGAMLMLAGPWYLRNWILTGNPVFPVTVNLGLIHFPGLFSVSPSRLLAAPRGLRATLMEGYFGMPPALFILLALAWAAALLRTARSLLADPQRRLLILGPPIGLLLFRYLSPYAEVRFVLPVFVLMFAAAATALAGAPWLQAVSLVIAALAVGTSFSSAHLADIAIFCAAAALTVVAGLLLWRLDVEVLGLRRGIPRAASLLVAIAAFFALTLWPAYLADYRAAIPALWYIAYGPKGDLWTFADQNIPASATLAYANQFMIYPLFGFDHRRKVIYAPLVSKLSIRDLTMPPHLSGEQIADAATAAANRVVDRDAWLRHLADAGAQYLLVGADGRPPEADLARDDPRHFRQIFQNEAGLVYRIDLQPEPPGRRVAPD